MLDSTLVTWLFIVLWLAFTWFVFTDVCARCFTVPGRVLLGVTLLLATTMWLHRAEAAELPPANKAEQIVRSQLSAFETKDDNLVFSMMSPDTQKVAKTPKDFHAWVEKNMPAMFDHESVIFGDPWPEKGSIMQPVIVFSVGKAYAFIFVVVLCAETVCIDNIVLLPIKLFGV